MSNYTKLTNFASKDSLASGNPLKVIKGTEIDDEFESIETAIGTKADSASPTFTGTPAAPTAASGTDSTQIATTAFVQDEITANAPTAGTGITITSGVVATASGYNGYGARTVSTSTPSGGSDGDIWYRYD
jgi:hypothetical protein